MKVQMNTAHSRVSLKKYWQTIKKFRRQREIVKHGFLANDE